MFFPNRSAIHCALFVMLTGCGSSSFSTSNPGVSPPHDGTVIPLPGTPGFVEVVKKGGTPPVDGEVAFYFYQDAKTYTPFDSPPEKGTLILDSKRSVELHLDDDALVTPSGPVLFVNRDVEGLLRVELDGNTLNVVLGGR